MTSLQGEIGKFFDWIKQYLYKGLDKQYYIMQRIRIDVMTTMLYEKETLEPCFLTSTNIKNDDVDVKFFVINGAWGGTFTKGKVLIHLPDYGIKWSSSEYNCYTFTQEDIDRMSYESAFICFKDLVEEGLIK